MINTNDRKNVDYFVGTEVENTPLKGVETLFVVGIKPVQEVQNRLNLFRLLKHRSINHVYLGTSQSFTPANIADWDEWDSMIKGLLKLDLHVTLDFDVQYVKDMLEYSWCEHNKFVPMISVKLPYIMQLNYNTTVKLDDVTWGYSNPGVWSYRLHDLMNTDAYTDWQEYKGDTPL